MILNLHQGNALAHLAAALRPDWTPAAAGTVFARANTGDGYPAADFRHAMQALVRYAADPTNVDLEPFTTHGAHWEATTPSPQENTMTTTATPLNLLDSTRTLGYAAETIPSTGATNELTVFTTLTITGEPDEARRGWADLKIKEEDYDGEAKFGFDAGQARKLAAFLVQIADELEARIA